MIYIEMWLGEEKECYSGMFLSLKFFVSRLS